MQDNICKKIYNSNGELDLFLNSINDKSSDDEIFIVSVEICKYFQWKDGNDGDSKCFDNTVNELPLLD